MLQTLLDKAWQDVRAGARRFFTHGVEPGERPDRPAAVPRTDSEKAGRVERDEAYYWGFSPYGPW